MRRILDLVDAQKVRLVENPLFLWLADESVSGRQRLSFIPAMLTYLMGFKDVLANLARPAAEHELDRMINAYCAEDAEHWRWYLDDMQRLGYELSSWGGDIPSFCGEVWSEATRVNRDTIFSLVHYSKSSADPLLALTLVQIFETTGVVFIGYTRRAAIALDMDDELLYFGRVHYEEEFGHTVQSGDLRYYVMSDKSYELARAAIEELFDQFDQMFRCWYDHRDRYETGGTV